jgi:hypothetical protein
MQPVASGGSGQPGGDNGDDGAVSSTADARLRVLDEVVGVGGLELADTESAFTATGDAPKHDVYEIPGGPVPRGTMIADPFGEYEPFVLADASYMFWIDPDPLSDLGHESTLAFVRASDGEVTRQTVEFPPIVGGMEHVFFQADRDANRIYRHELTTLLEETLADETPLEIAKTTSFSVQGEAPGFGGLFVGGTDEARRAIDADIADKIYQEMTGNPSSMMTPLRDSQGNRINADKLADALAEASEGLGECDKFVLVISTHGSETGQIRIGEDLITWEELCELIDENVTAQSVCAFFTACYGGLADEVFQAWDEKTDKGLTYFLATDSATEAVAIFPLLCAAEQFDEALAFDEGPIVPTISEIVQAMMNLNVTKESITQKICQLIERAAELGNNAAAAGLEGYKKTSEETGQPMVGGFDPSDPAPPEDDEENPFGRPFSPLTGTGTTNDGAGEFDLLGGTLESEDGGATIRLEGQMQITNQTGRDPGVFDLAGEQTGNDSNVFTFELAGTMQVFPEGQVENLTGTLTLTLHDDSVMVDFAGTHSGQAAIFNLTGPR